MTARYAKDEQVPGGVFLKQNQIGRVGPGCEALNQKRIRRKIAFR
jgi:hypothetical protein